MELKVSEKRRFFLDIPSNVKEDLYFLDCRIDNKLKKNINAKRVIESEVSLHKYKVIEEEIALVDSSVIPTFSKLVKEYMDMKSITPKDIYKNTLIDRKLFSSLNVNDNYVPSRSTAIMYCFALRLSYEQSKELLKSTGYAFYEYSNFDIIIKYFLDNKMYDIDSLNDSLYYYTNKCLGYK